jgi:hypothetical protein
MNIGKHWKVKLLNFYFGKFSCIFIVIVTETYL